MNQFQQSVIAVIGGQYGSEGKGKVVNFVAREELKKQSILHVVRCGSINSGHTVFYKKYGKQILRCIPLETKNGLVILV